jgi:hypothetical protein
MDSKEYLDYRKEIVKDPNPSRREREREREREGERETGENT